MATSVIGTLTEFNPEEQDAASYVERAEMFFEANNIAEEKKVPIFLTAVGQKTYEILRQLSVPKLLRENSFEEIVTLFKHSISGSKTSSTHHQAKADKPAQDSENASKPSTDLAQSQTSGIKRFINAVEKVIVEKREERESQNLQDALGPWEQSLTGEQVELDGLQELGLGIAIDITAKHPWVTKSAFQVKRVKKEDLVVINESNRSQRSQEQVETYTSIQQGLESSFRPDPTTPINVTVAADFHRSNSRSKTINSETVLTRTIAFRAKDPLQRSRDYKSEESFENNLHQWLVKRNCYPVECGLHTENSMGCGLYSETTNHHCIDYLKELGGVTHYVSSITLGATKYQVTLNSTLFTSLSSSSEVTAHTFASATTKSKASKKVFQSNSKEQHIGKIPEGKDDILRFRTKGEAVVQCSYNSLANLVSHPQLRKFLERGINEYIDMKKNGTRGPYHICTAELVLSKDSGEEKRSRLYWMIDWKNETSSSNGSGNNHRYTVVSTSEEQKASNFYLKPIVHSSSDKHFWIVTDPEDYGPKEKSKPQEDRRELKEQKPPRSDDCKPKSNGSGKYEPQRFVSMYKENLVVELSMTPNSARKSAFKLKNPKDDQTCPLHKSQWLPEALRGSQPYIIGREGQSFRTGLKKDQICSVHVKKEVNKIMHGSYREGGKAYGFFILETGHKT